MTDQPLTDQQADVIRAAMILSDQPAADLAANEDQTWTTDELQQDFDVLGFAAPFIVVTRKSDGVKGTLEFTSQPRIYFSFRED
jgi:hypothetical protein